MRLLLDTHIWLWYQIGDERLSKKLAKLIADPKTSLWLSPFSVWEAILLGEKRRIVMNEEPKDWVKKRLEEFKIEQASFNNNVALLSRTLAFQHNDPIDRFLAATAVDQNMTLATADKDLLNLKWLDTVS